MSKANDKFAALSGGASAPPATLARITKTAQRIVELEADIEAMEEQTAAYKKDLHKLKTETLPELMGAASMKEFTLTDGTEIEITEFCSGSLPKDPERRKKALELLVKYNAASLIKTQISLAFDRTDRARADKFMMQLTKAGYQFEAGEGVNAQTLAAFARERLRDGAPIDLDALGLYAGKTTKVKLAGKKKGGKK